MKCRFLIPLGCVLALFPCSVSAQCGMTTYIGVTQGCHVNQQAMVTTNGGTPPYTIVIEKRDALSQAFSQLITVPNDADGAHVTFGGPFEWDNTDRARVTVTDATNCVAMWTETLGVFVTFLPAPFVSINCAAGTSTIDIHTQLCPNGNLFSMDGGPLQVFLANWTYVSPGTYRYNGTLSPGSHSLVMSDTFCSSAPASPTYCYEPPSIAFAIPAVSPGDCGVNFRLRSALDGALPSGTLMTDALRASNLIPTAQPYTALGYTFVGSPTNMNISPTLLTITGNDGVVDWVVVELRSNTTTVVYSKPALLQRDGDVIDTDGDTYLNFPVSAGSYYVALRHRNHLGVMTSTARSLTMDPSATLIDFRGSTSGIYGTTPMVLKGSVYCLWAGDASGNGQIRYTGSGNDRDPILVAIGGSTPTNTVSNVYSPLDVNLDGVIKYIGTNNDRDVILTTVGGSSPNNTRAQQLP